MIDNYQQQLEQWINNDEYITDILELRDLKTNSIRNITDHPRKTREIFSQLTTNALKIMKRSTNYRMVELIYKMLKNVKVDNAGNFVNDYQDRLTSAEMRSNIMYFEELIDEEYAWFTFIPKITDYDAESGKGFVGLSVSDNDKLEQLSIITHIFETHGWTIPTEFKQIIIEFKKFVTQLTDNYNVEHANGWVDARIWTYLHFNNDFAHLSGNKVNAVKKQILLDFASNLITNDYDVRDDFNEYRNIDFMRHKLHMVRDNLNKFITPIDSHEKQQYLAEIQTNLHEQSATSNQVMTR